MSRRIILSILNICSMAISPASFSVLINFYRSIAHAALDTIDIARIQSTRSATQRSQLKSCTYLHRVDLTVWEKLVCAVRIENKHFNRMSETLRRIHSENKNCPNKMYLKANTL